MNLFSLPIIKIVIIGAALFCIGGFAAFQFMLYKDRTYYESPVYEPNKEKEIKVLVVLYSRTGHTANMAKEIARFYNADLINLEADIYSRDFKGWRQAAKDARYHELCSIKPETIDMSNYDLVFIGSPIWLFRPAPPLWTFVEKNDFQGKQVVLFNTFNSRFKQKMIDEFKSKVEAKNGNLIDHIYVKRGRMFSQKTGEEVIGEVQKILLEKSRIWQKNK